MKLLPILSQTRNNVHLNNHKWFQKNLVKSFDVPFITLIEIESTKNFAHFKLWRPTNALKNIWDKFIKSSQIVDSNLKADSVSS